MMHILFNEPDIQVLKKAIELDETLLGELFVIKDDYALGPVQDLYSPEGKENRKNWWNMVLEGGDYVSDTDSVANDDYLVIEEVISILRNKENEVVWIWAAQNKHDVCGYYWLLYYMKEFVGRVFILYLNNLPFINDKGNIFYPVSLSEIPAKEFVKAKKLAREITLSEFEVDPDEWLKIIQEQKNVRLLEGGKKLVQYDEHFYDAELKKYITKDWQKASKIIHNFASKAKHTTGEAFLLWRLKKLIASEEFEVQGKIANMKDFEIKLKVITTAVTEL